MSSSPVLPTVAVETTVAAASSEGWAKGAAAAAMVDGGGVSLDVPAAAVAREHDREGRHYNTPTEEQLQHPAFIRKELRPKQPEEERRRFEQMWVQNQRNSQCSAFSKTGPIPVFELIPEDPAALVKGVEMTEDGVSDYSLFTDSGTGRRFAIFHLDLICGPSFHHSSSFCPSLCRSSLSIVPFFMVWPSFLPSFPPSLLPTFLFSFLPPSPPPPPPPSLSPSFLPFDR
jgi:hypothetical protein